MTQPISAETAQAADPGADIIVMPEKTPFEDLLNRKIVINVGCGAYNPDKLHPIFPGKDWKEVRFDIDPAVQPDVRGTIVQMDAVPDASCDGLYSSHNIEHLYAYEVPLAFAEFRRVLKPTGFALLACPSMELIVEAIQKVGLEGIAYQSPAGPIRPLDMLFGLTKAIGPEAQYMAHRTGFTVSRLARCLQEAGFARVVVVRDTRHNLWAMASMPETDNDAILAALRWQVSKPQPRTDDVATAAGQPQDATPAPA